MNKEIVFFDMDGTLTPPRKKFHWDLEPALRDLSQWAEIGIVTGSDYNYLMDQMGKFLKNSPAAYHIHLLPCNGTKWYKPPVHHEQDHRLNFTVSMEHYLGESRFKELMKIILMLQEEVGKVGDIPLKGHFVDYRGSTINWCPIGRSAGDKERKRFVEYDRSQAFRTRYAERLNSFLSKQCLKDSLTIKLGGETSFDIFPKGWNKTFAFRHFPDWNYWFVGDRCDGNGNDREIYEACKERAFKTTSPETTKDIIYEIIKEMHEKNSD